MSGEITIVWGAEVRRCVKRRGTESTGDHVKGCVKRKKTVNEELRLKRSTYLSPPSFAKEQ